MASVHTAAFNDFTVNRAFLSHGYGVPLHKPIVPGVPPAVSRWNEDRDVDRAAGRSILKIALAVGNNGSIGASLMYIKSCAGNRWYGIRATNRKKGTTANVPLSIKTIHDNGDYTSVSLSARGNSVCSL